MNNLSRYIGSTVIGAILLVLFLIVGLDVVSAIIDQLGDLRGDYDFMQSIIYVGLTIPGRIHEYIPLAALVGCLVAMGMLLADGQRAELPFSPALLEGCLRSPRRACIVLILVRQVGGAGAGVLTLG